MQHLAIIADGNGRYGEKIGTKRTDGYAHGAQAIVRAITDFMTMPVDVLTFYAFSTENYKRNANEVSNIFQVIAYFLQNEIFPLAMENGVTVRFIGNYALLPQEIKEAIDVAPRFENGKTVVFAIGYGGDDEIVRACEKILQKNEKITTENLKNNLDTAGLPDVDAVLRYGGHKRLSNFMPLQTAYAELFFIDKLWPEYEGKDLTEVLAQFEKIKRNFGV